MSSFYLLAFIVVLVAIESAFGKVQCRSAIYVNGTLTTDYPLEICDDHIEDCYIHQRRTAKKEWKKIVNKTEHHMIEWSETTTYVTVSGVVANIRYDALSV